MRHIHRFDAAACLPEPSAVLKCKGISGKGHVSSTTTTLIEHALDLFGTRARPIGVYDELSTSDFGRVFAGLGKNDPDAPLASIYPRASRLCLFACTVGPELSADISWLFAQNEYALAYVLDAVASCGVERLADLLQESYQTEIPGETSDLVLLRYSPGYCGWHISGQRRLFDQLRPEEIGVSLRESYLMEPLKSVSGVFVLGSKEIHRFEPNFDFCRLCQSAFCRARDSARLEGQASEAQDRST